MSSSPADLAGHFGLRRNPFDSAGNESDIVDTGPFRAAREGVIAEIRAGSRLVVLIGPTGSGKSLVLRAVERAVGDERAVCRVDRAEFLRDASPIDCDLLLIDEAERLDDAALSAVVARARAANGPSVVLACIEPTLDRLAGTQHGQSAWIELARLTPSRARRFLTERLERAGSADVVSRAALDMIVDASGGSARLLTTLGRNALFQAALAGSSMVESAHAQAAIEMQGGVAARPQAAPVAEIAAPAPVVEAPAREPAIAAPEVAALALSAPTLASADVPLAVAAPIAPTTEPLPSRFAGFLRGLFADRRGAVAASIALVALGAAVVGVKVSDRVSTSAPAASVAAGDGGLAIDRTAPTPVARVPAPDRRVVTAAPAPLPVPAPVTVTAEPASVVPARVRSAARPEPRRAQRRAPVAPVDQVGTAAVVSGPTSVPATAPREERGATYAPAEEPRIDDGAAERERARIEAANVREQTRLLREAARAAKDAMRAARPGWGG